MAAAPSVAFDARTLPKLEGFSGKMEDWGDWSFSFRSYVALLGQEEALQMAEGLDHDPEFEEMSASLDELDNLSSISEISSKLGFGRIPRAQQAES